MWSFLWSLLSQLTYLVGYIRNGAYPSPLDKEKEEIVIKSWLEQHDFKARNQLIEHNLRLVAHVAKRYESKAEDIEELISIGTVGLIKAVDSFANDKGVKMATYAARCIENEILMHLRSNKKNRRTASLYDSIGEDKDGTELTIIDTLVSEEPSPGDLIDLRTNLSLLSQYLKILEPRELEIIEYRFGLNGKIEKTQKEIAKMLHISRSYISRIENRALMKLLQQFKKEHPFTH